jgi:hypothetical protein
VSFEVRVDPGVCEDLKTLATEQKRVPEDWRLSPEEIELAIDQAIRLIRSLRDDPFQGEPLRGEGTQRVRKGCRRLKFDPADPPPADHRGAPRPRMRLLWINEPEDSAVTMARVLAVMHRYESRPYRRAASRLGAVRRHRRPRG